MRTNHQLMLRNDSDHSHSHAYVQKPWHFGRLGTIAFVLAMT